MDQQNTNEKDDNRKKQKLIRTYNQEDLNRFKPRLNFSIDTNHWMRSLTLTYTIEWKRKVRVAVRRRNSQQKLRRSFCKGFELKDEVAETLPKHCLSKHNYYNYIIKIWYQTPAWFLNMTHVTFLEFFLINLIPHELKLKKSKSSFQFLKIPFFWQRSKTMLFLFRTRKSILYFVLRKNIIKI